MFNSSSINCEVAVLSRNKLKCYTAGVAAVYFHTFNVEGVVLIFLPG